MSILLVNLCLGPSKDRPFYEPIQIRKNQEILESYLKKK